MGRRQEQLEALAEVGRGFSAATTRDELVDVAVEAALEVLRADSGSIAEMEADRGLLRVLRNAGDLAAWEEERPADETYSVAEFPRLATAAEDAAPWFAHLDDPATDPAARQLLVDLGMDSSVSLPIVVGTRVWGEIGAARRAGSERFGPDDLPAGMALAGMFAAALAGLAMHDELRRLAYHDPLTGLGNRRVVDDRLEELFAAPLSGGLGLVLCDLNNLKAINDARGHHVGDRVLRDVGVLLTRAAGDRPGVLAARIGGDEFCLIVPDTDEVEVAAIAERLVTDAAALPLGDGVSCGTAVVTERPGDAPTAIAAARALLRLADAAQYRAKRAGRGAIASEHADPATHASAPVLTSTIVESVLPGVATIEAPSERLAHVAATVARAVDAAGWAVSVSVQGGPVTIVANSNVRTTGRDEDRPLEPGVGFDPGDYPATAGALAGGSFHATLGEGDPAERAFLAAFAYDETIGAGTPDGERAWLVEIAGDAATPPLGPYEHLLRVLVELAVHGRPHPVAERSGAPVAATDPSAHRA